MQLNLLSNSCSKFLKKKEKTTRKYRLMGLLIGILSVFMIWRGKKAIEIVVWPWGEQESQYDSVICVTNIRNFSFFFQPINSMIVWLCVCLRMVFPSSRWLTANKTRKNIEWSALIEFQASSNFLRYFFFQPHYHRQ